MGCESIKKMIEKRKGERNLYTESYPVPVIQQYLMYFVDIKKNNILAK